MSLLYPVQFDLFFIFFFKYVFALILFTGLDLLKVTFTVIYVMYMPLPDGWKRSACCSKSTPMVRDFFLSILINQINGSDEFKKGKNIGRV